MNLDDYRIGLAIERAVDLENFSNFTVSTTGAPSILGDDIRIPVSVEYNDIKARIDLLAAPIVFGVLTLTAKGQTLEVDLWDLGRQRHTWEAADVARDVADIRAHLRDE